MIVRSSRKRTRDRTWNSGSFFLAPLFPGLLGLLRLSPGLCFCRHVHFSVALRDRGSMRDMPASSMDLRFYVLQPLVLSGLDALLPSG